MNYIKRVILALIGKDAVVQEVKVELTNFGKDHIKQINQTFPCKQHRIGMTAEEHAMMAGQQQVIMYLSRMVGVV